MEMLVDNSIVLHPSGSSNDSVNQTDVEVNQVNDLALVPGQ